MEIDWSGKYFVTGIHTDAGKSYATGWLARRLNDAGGDCMTMKFVQTGNGEFSEDIDVHRRVMGIGMTSEDLEHLTAPEIFSYPCSPDLAAKLDGRDIDFDKIDSCADLLASRHKTLLIEGAGGLMVPLRDDYLTIDYVKDHQMPVILVTNGSLGSINHTLLSFLALKQYNLQLFAVIYNSYFDNDKIIAEDTRNYIKSWLKTHNKETIYMEMANADKTLLQGSAFKEDNNVSKTHRKQ